MGKTRQIIVYFTKAMNAANKKYQMTYEVNISFETLLEKSKYYTKSVIEKILFIGIRNSVLKLCDSKIWTFVLLELLYFVYSRNQKIYC